MQCADHNEVSTTSRRVAIYMSAKVGIFTSLYDGLNLKPFEFTVSQRENDPAALIVSEFLGCSRSLSGVERVNPWDVEQVCRSMYKAFTMTRKERKERYVR
jgi:trehalose-6-phosphate synthase